MQGTVDYLKGCHDAIPKGSADGNADGKNDQIAHAKRILPFTNTDIKNFVDYNYSHFQPIETEAYCAQVEKECMDAGIPVKDIDKMYPQCSLITPSYGYGDRYGEGYGYGKGYGQGYGYGKGSKPKRGGSVSRRKTPKKGGDSIPLSGEIMQMIIQKSADYIKGFTESYQNAYLMSYSAAWAVAKSQNITVPTPPIVLPTPYTARPDYGEGYGKGYGYAKGGGHVAKLKTCMKKAPKRFESQIKRIRDKTIPL
jgi:hypothetical protein